MPDPPGYRIVLTPTANRALARLAQDIQWRLIPRIERLSANPRPHGVRALQGPERLLRIRVGDYRIVYRIDDDTRLVQIVWLGHRRDAYRGY